jgi:4-hydroxythreonine-4-phosphate dehydrogenase
MSAKLAFTCGDPAGVGPEIIAAWLAAQAAEASAVAVIGPARWLETLGRHGVTPVAVGEAEYTAVPGQPDVTGARLALAALQRAADGCRTGEFSAVVTGPVSKEWVARVQPSFVGQTEFFAQQWGGAPTMCFCGGRLRVALATWHVPLCDVAGELTEAVLSRTVRAADELARADGIAAPRIGVCGLNPHAGEGGLLGTEERDFIDPVCARLRLQFPGLSRCAPGDTLFARALRGEFDVVLALYHDQGLGPLKTVDFDEAVNVTLGLPFVRTSPDHGTAFSLAGRGVASARSFTNAVTVARKLVAWRLGRPAAGLA